MSRKPYCDECGLYLGEIRDATLRKGIKLVAKCGQCKTPAEPPDFFKSIFGVTK